MTEAHRLALLRIIMRNLSGVCSRLRVSSLLNKTNLNKINTIHLTRFLWNERTCLCCRLLAMYYVFLSQFSRFIFRLYYFSKFHLS